jgi:hypothetical protein
MSQFWRFTSVLLVEPDFNVKWKWQNPVPIYGAKGLVGFGAVYWAGGALAVDACVEYSIPERLDAENGNVWTVPFVEVQLASLTSVNPGTEVNINKIVFTNDCTDPRQEPIGGMVL